MTKRILLLTGLLLSMLCVSAQQNKVIMQKPEVKK